MRDQPRGVGGRFLAWTSRNPPPRPSLLLRTVPTATPTEARYVATEVPSSGRFDAFEASGDVRFIEESDTFNEELTAVFESE